MFLLGHCRLRLPCHVSHWSSCRRTSNTHTHIEAPQSLWHAQGGAVLAGERWPHSQHPAPDAHCVLPAHATIGWCGAGWQLRGVRGPGSKRQRPSAHPCGCPLRVACTCPRSGRGRHSRGLSTPPFFTWHPSTPFRAAKAAVWQLTRGAAALADRPTDVADKVLLRHAG